MCTAITLQHNNGNTYFGRTMDFSYPLDPSLYFFPKNHKWSNILNTHNFYNNYSFMGIGQDISPIAFADGVNEMGFAAAALYFPGFAAYTTADLQAPAKPPVAAIELVNFLLGMCSSVKHAVSILSTIQIVGTKDSVTNSVAPLHWIIADKSGKCMVIEKTANKLNIIENPIGVLSNSPDFEWHMTNLRNYMNISPYQAENGKWDTIMLTPFGQGGGTFGLPGDYTPPARFIRAAYQKSHAIIPDNKEDIIMTCFHIMESVSIPKGIVMTDRGTADYTQYTAFIDISSKEYFLKTYNNNQITYKRLPPNIGSNPKILCLGKLIKPTTFENF